MQYEDEMHEFYAFVYLSANDMLLTFLADHPNLIFKHTRPYYLPVFLRTDL